MIKSSRDFKSVVKVKNYLFGKKYTYYNALQKINSSTEFTFDIHPNVSFYLFIQDPKYELLSTRPSIVKGFYDKYQVCYINNKY